MDSPAISVVVPTHNRRELLAGVLQALESQTIGTANFEAIVVDDGSVPPLDCNPPPGLNLQIVRHFVPLGPAAARNSGWRAARGALIAFTDDDCQPADRWLEALVERWSNVPDRVVQGRTEPEPGHVRDPLSRTMKVRGVNGLYQTCNIAYPRAVLERTGGFDESFRHACGEDVDLGLRAKRAGSEAVFASDALVHHAVHKPSLRAMIRHARIWSDAVRVMKRYPELRSMLIHGVFWKRTHPLWLLAVIGVAASLAKRSSVPAMVGVAPYALHYLRTYADAGEPHVKALGNLPVHAVVDGAEVVTMIEGSARYRTLML